MNSITQQPNQFGWDEWFNVKVQEMGLVEHRIARVVAVDRAQLLVMNETGEFRAKLAGRFLYMTEQPSDFPCVVDWVAIQCSGSDDFGIIHRVLPRKSYLCRKTAGDAIEYQMIASNTPFYRMES